jgi:cytosolic phospholipase A2
MTYGERSIPRMIDHFKARLGKSFTDPYATFPLMMERPTNKYLLRGLVERFKEGYTELGMVDIYGTLVSSRILVPANELDIRDDWLKLSNQRRYVDDGTEPLPIYTAVRHEIPRKVSKEEKKEENGEVKDLGSTGDDKTAVAEAELHQKAREESWFQWFEITPYYLGCEELEAWIPTWGVGRQYNNGTNITRTPELRLPIIIGYQNSSPSDFSV